MEMNLLDDDGWLPRTWPPERAGFEWRRKRVAGEHLGDCVLFPSGQAGARQVINRSETEVRVLLVSNFAMPRAAVQPDSRKLMIRWGPDAEERAWFPLDAAADYWEGEERPDRG